MSAVITPLSMLLPGDRGSFRSIGDPYKSYQERRRHHALQRQKAARLHNSHLTRTLALENLSLHDDDDDDDDNDREQRLSVGGEALDGAEDTELEPSTSYGSRTDSMSFRGRGARGRAPRNSGWRRQQGQATGAGGVRAYGQRYGNELMQPEWMTDVPSDLATNWLLMPRPEGMRCLLVTSRGRTVSWLRNGAPLHRFHSSLPGGSPATAAGSGGSAAAAASSGDYCLLDCIFHSPNNTYYVQDLLCWRGYALYDTAAEFRNFWLISKFQEEGLMQQPVAESCGLSGGCDVDTDMGSGGGSGGAADNASWASGSWAGRREASASYRIVPLPVRPCTLQGLRAAYGRVPPPPAAAGIVSDANELWSSGTDTALGDMDLNLDLNFLRDGLYFLHRHGHYSPGPGNSPLALLWKDLGCSRYLLDTDSNGQPLEHQTVVLSYRADRTVSTEDEPPVVLGKLPEAFMTALDDKVKPGRLLRFSIRQGGIMFHEGRPVGADLHYEGPANQRRGRADSFSKILFQRLARTAPITGSMLAAAVTASEAAAAAAGSHIGLEGAGMTVE